MPLFILITYLSGLIGLPNIEDHAVYVSVIEIDKADNSDKASLRFKLFADDLEDAIHNQSGIRTDLLKGDCRDARELIEKYLEAHFMLMINNKAVEQEYISCELNDISIWIEFELETPEKWNSVEVKADYLLELFPTQNNVVSITYQKQKRMFRLMNNKTSETIHFD
ncbi:MAG: DUF6702 family protein [Bacteroidota bacterium]